LIVDANASGWFVANIIVRPIRASGIVNAAGFASYDGRLVDCREPSTLQLDVGLRLLKVRTRGTITSRKWVTHRAVAPLFGWGVMDEAPGRESAQPRPCVRRNAIASSSRGNKSVDQFAWD
jgi:hypothetical protein